MHLQHYFISDLSTLSKGVVGVHNQWRDYGGGGGEGANGGNPPPNFFTNHVLTFFIRFGRNQYCYSAILLYLFIMSLHKLETDRPIMTILISVLKAVNALVKW